MKTPRKRAAPNQAQLSATARVLFQNRPATVEEAMPSPRKPRKSRKHTAFTLESFAQECEEEASSSKIEIYTDSKDRVPEVDNDDSNPFITRKGTAKKQQSAANADFLKRRKHDSHYEEMEEKAKNGEGMVYVLYVSLTSRYILKQMTNDHHSRGKKVFRRFDTPANETSGSETETVFTDMDLRRKAGGAARRPFTRSTVKPRLLFPNEEQRRQLEERANDAEDDEEAVTDIEGPDGTIISGKDRLHPNGTEEKRVVTPVKQLFRPATPPSTGHATRSSTKKHALDASPSGPPHDLPQVDVEKEAEVTPSASSSFSQQPSKKASPFDMWQRTKPAGGRVVSKKREAEPMVREGEETGKRTRSGVYRAA